MENKDILVVVLSRNYSTGLSIIRSLGPEGYTIDLVASAHKPGYSEIAACSKYLRNAIEIVSSKFEYEFDEDEHPLINKLVEYENAPEKYRVLIPVDDYTVSVIDRYRDELSPIFSMPYIVGGDTESMIERASKSYQSDIAAKAGLATPWECSISLSESDALHIPEDTPYPCFCKPAESFTGYKGEMAKCSSKGKLLAHLGKLCDRNSDRSVLVQEFLTIDREIDIQGVCNDQEIIIPALINKTSVARHDRGVTLAGDVAPFEELGSVCQSVEQALKSLHYVGMFDMEINVVGDQYYFNEINLRCGGPNYAFYGSGVNLPDLFVKICLGLSISEDERHVREYGKHFVYERMAWLDYSYGFMKEDELKEILDSGDILLFQNDDDPAPGELFLEQIKTTSEERLARRNNKKKPLRSAVLPAKRQVSKLKGKVFGYPQLNPENARSADEPLPRVLVVGRNYCSNLCLARCLGQAGYNVEVLRLFRTNMSRRKLAKVMRVDAMSKYIKAFDVVVSHRKRQTLYRKIMQLADPDRKMLLLTADDVVASTFDRYYNRLSEAFVLSSIGEEQDRINDLMDKSVQKQLAREAGLPVLNGNVVKTYRGTANPSKKITYPCIIKPNKSRSGSKSRIRRCDSREELIATLEEFSQRRDIEMLVEDFVDIKREYSILGVCAGGKVSCAGFFGALHGGNEEHRGVAATGEVLDPATMQPLVDKIGEFMLSLNYDGLFDVDLIEDQDGNVYFIEINFRFGASGYAITECGVNLPGMYADYKLKGIPIDDTARVTKPGAVFVNERILLDEYREGRMSRQEFKEILNSEDIHFIKNEEDPEAFKFFERVTRIVKFLK